MSVSTPSPAPVSRAGALALLLAIAAGGLWLGARALPGAPHPVGAPCAECHLTGERVTKKDAHLLVASQESLCGRCHPGALEVSHPSGFRPAKAVPVDFPLDWKGDLTCSSCHAVHHHKPGRLRGKHRGRDLCLACHDAQFFAKMRDHGESITQSGHVDARPGAHDLSLDAYSVQCLGCHAERASTRRMVFEAGGLMRHAAAGINHPVGMRYANYLDYGGFRDPTQLPKGILLPEGKVGCVSCHVGYSAKHGALVVSNHGSGLCFGCHDL